MNSFNVSALYIYPIKSLGGIRIQKSEIVPTGLRFDRNWMLINRSGTFITQRKHHNLALLQVSIEKDMVTVSHKNDPSYSISFGVDEHLQSNIPVTIWDDNCFATEVSQQMSKWFSEFMQADVRLVKMAENERRLVDPRYALDHEVTSFSDGYPCLIIGQASLDNLNSKLQHPVPIDRFRPNIVFTGGDAHVEDKMLTFSINTVVFKAVKPCARCVLTTVNQQTGVKEQEPLKTLASYRTVGKKVLFGQNLLHIGSGVLNEGDSFEIMDWKTA